MIFVKVEFSWVAKKIIKISGMVCAAGVTRNITLYSHNTTQSQFKKIIQTEYNYNITHNTLR